MRCGLKRRSLSTAPARSAVGDCRYSLAWQNKWHQFLLSDALSLMRKVPVVADDAVLNFKFCRRRAHINRLVRQLHEFIEIKRAIVECARQTKTVIYEHSFARPVAFVHPADLRDRGVRF